MAETVTISGAGAHASAAATDRVPASKGPFTPGSKGYLTLAQIATLVSDTMLAVAGHSVLAASRVAVPHTGDTIETVKATVTIPAGVMGLNGVLRVTTLWSYPNNANTKTLRVRFGGLAGTVIATQAATTTASYQETFTLGNRNAANSQVGNAANLSGKVGGTSSALITAAVDTAAAVDLVFTAQCGNATDTITLEGYIVELLRP